MQICKLLQHVILPFNFTCAPRSGLTPAMACEQLNPDTMQRLTRNMMHIPRSDLTPAMACDVLHACAQLRVQPDGACLSKLLDMLYTRGLRHAPATKVCNLIVALEAFGHHPGQAWLYHYSQVRLVACAGL